jgi:hypothetical protein
MKGRGDPALFTLAPRLPMPKRTRKSDPDHELQQQRIAQVTDLVWRSLGKPTTAHRLHVVPLNGLSYFRINLYQKLESYVYILTDSFFLDWSGAEATFTPPVVVKYEMSDLLIDDWQVAHVRVRHRNSQTSQR